MFKSFLTIGVWTLVSRILGLVRDQLLATFMGAGALQDAFQVAFRLPNMFRRLFGEGAFNAAFVPQFSSLLETEGKESANQFAREALGTLLLWLFLLAMVGEIFMPWVIQLIAPGFVNDPERYRTAINLSRITFPYLILVCAAALLSGVLNSLRRFGLAAAAYASFNVVGICAILWLSHFTANVAYAAAWGITISGFVQLSILAWGLYKSGMIVLPALPCLSVRIKFLIRKMAPGLVGSGVTQINLMVDTIIGTLLPVGSISLIYFADRINQLPLGVLGVAAGTALLPVLTRHLAAGKTEDAHKAQNQAIEYTLLLTLPAAMALITIGGPIMISLFGYGAFDVRHAALAAQSLCAYAVGLPAFVLIKVLSPGFFARNDTETPVRIGIFTLLLNFILNLIFMVPLAHIGPPLASSVAAIANVLALGFFLRRRGGLVLDAGLVTKSFRILLAACLMAAILWAMKILTCSDIGQNSASLRAMKLSALIITGGGSYLLFVHLLGVSNARSIVKRLLRKQG